MRSTPVVPTDDPLIRWSSDSFDVSLVRVESIREELDPFLLKPIDEILIELIFD
jgi:hypothetical protein